MLLSNFLYSVNAMQSFKLGSDWRSELSTIYYGREEWQLPEAFLHISAITSPFEVLLGLRCSYTSLTYTIGPVTCAWSVFHCQQVRFQYVHVHNYYRPPEIKPITLARTFRSKFDIGLLTRNNIRGSHCGGCDGAGVGVQGQESLYLRITFRMKMPSCRCFFSTSSPSSMRLLRGYNTRGVSMEIHGMLPPWRFPLN